MKFLYIIGESIIVGLMLILYVYIASWLIKPFSLSLTLPDICKTWNQNYIMEITLFLAGFLFHSTFEIFGWNMQYCKRFQ